MVRMGVDMLIVAVLTISLFAFTFLMLFSRIAKTRRMRKVFDFLQWAPFFGACHYLKNLSEYDAVIAIFCLSLFSVAISEGIAIPILRRRVRPPVFVSRDPFEAPLALLLRLL